MTSQQEPEQSSEFPEVTVAVPPRIVSNIVQAYAPKIPSKEEVQAKAIERMEIGDRAIEASGTIVNTAALEEAFEDGTGNFSLVCEEKSKTILDDVSEVYKAVELMLENKVCAVDSDMAQHLENAKSEMESLLENAGDPNIEGTLAHSISIANSTSMANATSQIDKAMDLGNPDSHASKQLKTLVAVMSPIATDMAQMKADIKVELEKLAVASGYSKMKTHDQGDNFQEAVGNQLSTISEKYADLFDQTATDVDSSSNSKKGDHLSKIMLGEAEVGRIVFESKSGADWTLTGTTSKSIQKELEESIAVNKADYGVAVVDASHAKTPVEIKDWYIFNPQPNMFVVGVNWAENNFVPLNFIYRWLRIQLYLNHYQQQDEEGLDIESILSDVKHTRNEIKTVTKVISNLSKLESMANNQKVDLQEYVKKTVNKLTAIETALGGGGAN